VREIRFGAWDVLWEFFLSLLSRQARVLKRDVDLCAL
jgi:hypothetical protein